MDFYTNPLSPNCRKVDATAKQLGIELNRKLVDVSKGEHKTPAYLAINPNGLVPALVDGDVKLWESNAIQCYLGSKVDSPMWPKSNVRYDIMRWQAWELAHFGAAARSIIRERLIKPLLGRGEPDMARVQEGEEQFKRFGAVLDAHLNDKRFLVDDQLTLADFCVASTLTYAAQASLPIGDFTQLRRWLGALDEQPGWRASAPPPM